MQLLHCSFTHGLVRAICVATLLAASALAPALAQAGAAASAPAAKPPCGDEPLVTQVRVDETGRKPVSGSGANAAYLNDRISLKVCALDKLIAKADADQKKLSLFINGVDTGIVPSGIDRQADELNFKLRRTAQNSELWKPLLSNPLQERDIRLRISVGVAGGEPAAKAEGADTALPFNKLWVDGWTYAAGTLIVLVIVLTAHFGKNSDMLRDGAAIDGKRQTFSLARVQMAWWFVLVIAGFIVILLVSGETDSIPATIVALTGISATTGVAAVLITPRPAQRAAARKAQLDEQRSVLTDGITEIDGAIADVDQKLAAAQAAAAGSPQALTLARLRDGLQQRRDDRAAELGQITLRLTAVSPNNPSKGFWRDLVTDDRGAVALDRLQMVVWTMLLGGLYLHSVLVYVTMPDFSATLLALMGVSSGTYIGFKMPDKS